MNDRLLRRGDRMCSLKCKNDGEVEDLESIYVGGDRYKAVSAEQVLSSDAGNRKCTGAIGLDSLGTNATSAASRALIR